MVGSMTSIATRFSASIAHTPSFKVILGMELILYQGALLYIQFKLIMLYSGDTFITHPDLLHKDARAWIQFEILCFYMYILSAIVFLGFISCRNTFYKIPPEEDQRKKFDE